jgi:hypothetical protein
MSDIHDWAGAMGAPGFREALLAYGRANGRIKPKGRLPKDEDELKLVAGEAIESGDTEFSLEDADGERGSTEVRLFSGRYWLCDWGGISGPVDSLEEAAADVLSMAVGQDCPGFYSAASGGVSDDFIATRSVKLVKPGKTFLINGTPYLRTKTGLVPQ